jgi:hypothetical protein
MAMAIWEMMDSPVREVLAALTAVLADFPPCLAELPDRQGEEEKDREGEAPDPVWIVAARVELAVAAEVLAGTGLLEAVIMARRCAAREVHYTDNQHCSRLLAVQAAPVVAPVHPIMVLAAVGAGEPF